MEAGHLRIEGGVAEDRYKVHLPCVNHRLKRLVCIGNDGFITLSALRWLSDLGASFVMSGSSREGPRGGGTAHNYFVGAVKSLRCHVFLPAILATVVRPIPFGVRSPGLAGCRMARRKLLGKNWEICQWMSRDCESHHSAPIGRIIASRGVTVVHPQHVEDCPQCTVSSRQD